MTTRVGTANRAAGRVDAASAVVSAYGAKTATTLGRHGSTA
jgi:hypothetical protein